MTAKSSASDDLTRLVVDFLQRGEETVSHVLDELRQGRSFTDRLGETVHAAAEARRAMERNVQAVLAALNVPTRADIDGLEQRLDRLQGTLVNVSMKLDRLLAAQQEAAARAEAAAKKRPPRPGKGGGKR